MEKLPAKNGKLGCQGSWFLEKTLHKEWLKSDEQSMCILLAAIVFSGCEDMKMDKKVEQQTTLITEGIHFLGLDPRFSTPRC